MAAMLAKLGARASLAHNGQEALERVAAQPFDLVLMDCQMPVMDGYAATASIRALTLRRTTRLPIVAVTANSAAADERKCLAAGMDGFLPKPFTLAQLRGVLVQWLPAIPENGTPAPDAPPTASAAESGAAINDKALANLRELDPVGGDALVATVLRMFMESAEATLQSAKCAVVARDGAQLSRLAHAMKSSAANIGAEALAELYRRLESAGRDGRIEEAQSLLAQVEREQDRALNRIREILAESA
jgi:CheY-like chemotaxis protein